MSFYVPARQAHRVGADLMRQTCSHQGPLIEHMTAPLVCVLAAGHRGDHRGVTDLMGPDEFWWAWDQA